MIIEALVNIIVALIETVIGGLLSLLPDAPGWFLDAMGQVSVVTAWVGQLDAWVPVGLAFTIAGAVLAVYLAGITIGAVRWIASYFLGGGGTT